MGSDDAAFDELIEKSSLGTPGARQLRARTSESHADVVRQIIKLRNVMAHGSRNETVGAANKLLQLFGDLGYDEQVQGVLAEAFPGQEAETVMTMARLIAGGRQASPQKARSASDRGRRAGNDSAVRDAAGGSPEQDDLFPGLAEPGAQIRLDGRLVGQAAPALLGPAERTEPGLEVLVPIGRLVTGQTFHRAVQLAFFTGLVGALGYRERQWRLISGGRGRVDLAVEVDGGEQILLIIEIKGTDWDKIPAARLRRNLRRHAHQLQEYLDTAVEEMESGTWAGIAGRLLYPARPTSKEAQAAIDAIAGEQAIEVAWYEDVQWRPTPAHVAVRARYPQPTAVLSSSTANFRS